METEPDRISNQYESKSGHSGLEKELAQLRALITRLVDILMELRHDPNLDETILRVINKVIAEAKEAVK